MKQYGALASDQRRDFDQLMELHRTTPRKRSIQSNAYWGGKQRARVQNGSTESDVSNCRIRGYVQRRVIRRRVAMLLKGIMGRS